MSMHTIPQESATLALARLYARLGWSPIPVREREKMPAIAWAPYQHQQAEDGRLVEWFERDGFGIGLVQGAFAGTIVLDFDGDEGMETRAALEAQYGALPATVEALTPGGGCHVLLRHPGVYTPTRKHIRPGMDVRGDGGFIVVHPSVHPSGGRYEWDCDRHPEDVPVAPCPQWVADMICDPTLAPGNDEAIVHVQRRGALGLHDADVVADGREVYMRNTVLAVLTDLMGALGRLPTLDELFDVAWAQYSRNVDLTRPGRGADELRAKCRYTLARLAAGVLRIAPKVSAASPPSTPADAPVAPPRNTLRLLSIEELEALPPPEWLIDGLVPAKSLVMPYGPPKKGKTFIALSMALHISAGKDWMGRPVKQGGVIYIAGEGVGGLGNRIRAMRSHYGFVGHLPFWIATRAVNLSDADAVSSLIKLIRDTVLDEPIELVIVDTLARASPGVDENSVKEMGVVIAACDQIKDEFECTVMPVHHAGKDEKRGARGTSAIHGALDASFHVTSAGRKLTLTPVDQKDADPGDPMVFEMLEVMTGIGRSSLVPSLLDGSDEDDVGEDNRKAVNLSLQEEVAMRALDEALAAGGGFVPGSVNVPGNVPACRSDEWREAYRKLRADSDWESARKAFGRVSMSLIRKRIVGCSQPYVWKVWS